MLVSFWAEVSPLIKYGAFQRSYCTHAFTSTSLPRRFTAFTVKSFCVVPMGTKSFGVFTLRYCNSSHSLPLRLYVSHACPPLASRPIQSPKTKPLLVYAWRCSAFQYMKLPPMLRPVGGSVETASARRDNFGAPGKCER